MPVQYNGFMRFRVVPTHQRGVLRPKGDISRSEGIVGDLVTAHRSDDFPRRSTMVATLNDLRRGVQTALLPPLYDAALVLIAPGGIMIAGCERLALDDGRYTEFSQGWWARPL
jgi:hypothetical protein